MAQKAPQIGCTKAELDTPALCLDLDIFAQNIEAMVATCRRHHVAWRPHVKCHKSPAIAERLMAAGASGLTCATLDEAETMADAGIEDLLIANMVAGPKKIERLMALAACAQPIICLDHPAQAMAISAAAVEAGVCVRALIELEIGLRRVGVDNRAALHLAREVDALPGVQLCGVMAYEGHLLTIEDQSQKVAAIAQALAAAVDCQQTIIAQGVACPIVSCGGTGSYPMAVAQPGVTEIQAGGAIFMDAFYRDACQIRELDFALTILATVVSRPAPDRAVIDAGRKAMNIEIHTPQVIGRPGVSVAWLSAEHGILKLEPRAAGLAIGETIELIPGYADLTTVLHPCFWAFRHAQLHQLFPIFR